MMPTPIQAVMLAIALMVGVPPARAAVPDTMPSSAELARAPDDGELGEFVAAFVRLIGVQHGYMMLMQAEDDPARVEELKQEAIAEMTDAIEQDGMSVDRYNSIAIAVRDDSRLQGRVEAILEQLASDPDAQ